MAEVLVVDAAVDQVNSEFGVRSSEFYFVEFGEHGADAGFVVGGLANGEGGVAYLLPTAAEVGVGDYSGKAAL